MPDEKLHIVRDGTRKSKPLPESKIRDLYLARKITTDAVVTQVGTSLGVPVLDFLEDEEEVDSVQLAEDQAEDSPEPQSPLFVVTAIGKKSRPATPQQILDIYDRGSIEESATVSEVAGQHSWPIASFLNHYFPGTAQEHAPKGEPARSAELKSGGDLMTRSTKTFVFWCVISWIVLTPLFAYQDYQARLETDFIAHPDFKYLIPSGPGPMVLRSSVRAASCTQGFFSATFIMVIGGGVGYLLWFTRPTSSRSKIECPE